MTKHETITLEPQAVWQDELAGYTLRNASLDPNNEICLLLATSDPELIDGSFVQSKTAEFIDYKVIVLSDSAKTVIPIPQQPWNYHHIQLFGKDQLLLVCAGAVKYENGEADENARIFDTEGNFVRSFCLGDGIEQISATADKKIWTGYFDEGVFGNHGWDDPIGKHGLINWNEFGEIIYTYEQPNKHFIMDCLALNAPSDDEVWFKCGLWDSQIGIRRNGKTTYYMNEEVPLYLSAFAMDDDYLLSDDTGRNNGIFHLAKRTGAAYHKVNELSFMDPAGKRIFPLRVSGRGAKLLLQCENESYLFDLAEYRNNRLLIEES
ncbi:hypothetical protein [Metaplanococcus flavidus]|uniref:Uncharacterized protein n=1 Tax=Metaplanococcus flavidus TaxID=569883 RepID=A0ABW3LDX5_9BACL